MNKLNHIESVLEAVRDDVDLGEDEKSVRYDMIDGCVEACVQYHNMAVDQGRSLVIQRFRMDFADYAKYIERLHEQRKEMHRAMIDHIAVLNQLCSDYRLDKIYKGPMDLSKGRGDDDTRFGAAAFGEELCRDLFKTTHEYGVPAKAEEAYKDYAKRVRSNSSMSALQRMMARAEAQSKMDSREYGD